MIDADGDGERQPDGDTFEHGARAGLQAQGLEEEDDLEALPVDGREAEDGEPEQGATARFGPSRECRRRRGCAPRSSRSSKSCGRTSSSPRGGPRRPGGRWLPGRRARGRRARRSRGSRGTRSRRTVRSRLRRRQRPAGGGAVHAHEARGERGDHENRLEALAEDEEAAVEDHCAVAEVSSVRGRVGNAGRRVDGLPREHPDRGSGDDPQAARRRRRRRVASSSAVMQ